MLVKCIVIPYKNGHDIISKALQNTKYCADRKEAVQTAIEEVSNFLGHKAASLLSTVISSVYIHALINSPGFFLNIYTLELKATSSSQDWGKQLPSYVESFSKRSDISAVSQRKYKN